MNATKQALWLFLALISLAFSGWYFASTPKAHLLNESTLSKLPDAVIHNLHVSQFNEQGLLANYLHTPLLQHVPKNDTHWLKQPYIKVTQPSQEPWVIRSKQATSIGGGKQVTFNQNVVMQQVVKNQENTLLTEEITYFPKEKKATTDKKVTFKQPGSLIESIGMIAFLEEKRVKLLNQATGIYEPKHAQKIKTS